jgi:cysteinyl-tRNA synthetase
MELYNTLSRTKETLPEPEKQLKIRLFVCGPTVYDYTHIGHARTYIFFDFFTKYLRSRGYEVNYLQNITDIDDRIIARAAERNMKPDELAKEFSEAYLADMKALDVDAVTTYAPATNFISQIVAQVERLIDKNFAYEIPGDGWYFDISKDEDYGKLSGRTVAQAEDSVSRIDNSDAKRNKGDFCLWKFSKPGEPIWTTRIGAGRPGWHIEDTAISEYYFGPQYDIHGGADDLKFPHHEAEIAQQESASGLKPFVRFWVHTGFLLSDGKKMSKSLGNFITVREFLKKYPPEILRWLTLSHHYRSPFDFSDNDAKQAEAALGNIYQKIYLLSKSNDETVTSAQNKRERYEQDFSEVLDDDLNTPKALAVMHQLIDASEIPSKDRIELLHRWGKLLGLGFENALYNASEEAEIAQKLVQYDEFRVHKQFMQSDALRKEIEALGYEVRDTKDGSEIVKKFF